MTFKNVTKKKVKILTSQNFLAKLEVTHKRFSPATTPEDLAMQQETDNTQYVSNNKHSEESSRKILRLVVKLVPPLNFSLVENGIYRSGFPMPINYPFLKQLRLKTIIYLGDLGNQTSKKGKKKDKHGTAEIMNNYLDWIKNDTEIRFYNLLFESSQEPFNKPDDIQQATQSLTFALQLILNKENYPILIHSNKGKHRTGVLIGIMRKVLQGWCLSGIFEEYEKFAMGKSEYDLELIELWQPELYIDDANKTDFVRI